MSGSGEKRSLVSRWFGLGGDKTGNKTADKIEDKDATKEAAETSLEAKHDTPPPPAEPEPVELDSADRDTRPETGPETGDVTQADPPVVAETASQPPATEEPPKKASWFQRLKSGLSKTSSKISEGITTVFARRKLDADSLQDLEDILIQADLGLETSMRIVDAISKGRYDKGVSADEVREILAKEVASVLAPVARPLVLQASHKPHVILMVGVNGTGKTTTIGKLANQFMRDGKSVMLAAGDTFRAAAIDQLKVWGERTGVPVIARDVGADAAGLAFDALKAARESGADVLMIDTAGRLQNKQELMAELEKVIRVIKKLNPDAPHDVVLVLDATTGQNALGQVEVFRDKAGVTGLIMTKLDGTARGGILVAIAAKYGLPVHAIGVGESADDLQPFVAEEFARALALN